MIESRCDDASEINRTGVARLLLNDIRQDCSIAGATRRNEESIFAGAWAMLCAMKHVGDPDISEDLGIAYFEGRQREGEKFYRDLIKQYADRN